jgi:hypothetical protein
VNGSTAEAPPLTITKSQLTSAVAAPAGVLKL